jgi:hypothetical protein
MLCAMRYVARLQISIAFAGIAVIATSCSRDPRTIKITADGKTSFSELVTSKSGLAADDLLTLQAAEARLKRASTIDSVVGKTIGDVIDIQKRWQAERLLLVDRLEPVYRAAKEIDAATRVGINFARYGELIRTMATELSVATDKLTTEEERRVTDLFTVALRTHQDAGTFWQVQIQKSYYEDVYEGGVGYSIGGRPPNSELVPLVEKYHLPIRSWSGYGGRMQSLSKNSIQVIWALAAAHTAAATDAYLAK